MTQCAQEPIRFQGPGRRQVVARFNGGRISSDGVSLLLQSADGALDVLGRMAACFDDDRDPARTEHGLEELLRQRVFGIGMGYEDLNDHDRIRSDSPSLTCAVERRAFLVGANPARQLSLQPEAAERIKEATRWSEQCTRKRPQSLCASPQNLRRDPLDTRSHLP